MHLFDIFSCCFAIVLDMDACLFFFVFFPDEVFVASVTSVVHLKPAVLEG